MKKFLIFIVIIAFFLNGGSVLAFMSSQNYRIDEDSLSFGEVPAERGNYSLESTFSNIANRAVSKIQGSFAWILIGFFLSAILLGVILKIKRKGIKTKVYSKD
jgi:hypothetical protein